MQPVTWRHCWHGPVSRRALLSRSMYHALRKSLLQKTSINKEWAVTKFPFNTICLNCLPNKEEPRAPCHQADLPGSHTLYFVTWIFFNLFHINNVLLAKHHSTAGVCCSGLKIVPIHMQLRFTKCWWIVETALINTVLLQLNHVAMRNLKGDTTRLPRVSVFLQSHRYF